jgi:hypothetical protein
VLKSLTLHWKEIKQSMMINRSTGETSPDIQIDLAWQLPASTAPPGNQAIAIEAPIVLRVDIGSAVKQQP